MNGLVEKVARAMWEERRSAYKRDIGADLDEWGDGTIPFLNGVREEAIAALKAMRDISIQQEAPGVVAYAKVDKSCRPVALEAAWQAIIDAAIQEHSNPTRQSS